jgi:N6-L-threonylcarbamoyladenine synthase
MGRIEFGKALGEEYGKPVFAADHVKGHLYSFLLGNPRGLKSLFPMAALVVSGGHTILFLLESLSSVKKLGETRMMPPARLLIREHGCLGFLTGRPGT